MYRIYLFDMSSDTQKKRLLQETATERHISALLLRIDAYCARRTWTEGYFSKTVAGDTGVIHRLRVTRKVTVAKMIEIERFLDNEKKHKDI